MYVRLNSISSIIVMYYLIIKSEEIICKCFR